MALPHRIWLSEIDSSPLYKAATDYSNAVTEFEDVKERHREKIRRFRKEFFKLCGWREWMWFKIRGLRVYHFDFG